MTDDASQVESVNPLTQAVETAVYDGVTHPETQDGLEILLTLTRTGKIDPWNIDIASVADEYLKAVADLKASDLKITGKTLLFLAILLRMKSDKLAGIDYLDPPEDDPTMDDFFDEPKELTPGVIQPRLPYKTIDEFLERRTSMKQRRIRKVTLVDLIQELKKYEALDSKQRLRRKVESDDDRRGAMQDYSQLTSDDIEELAHDEFIEETILRLKDILERLLFGSDGSDEADSQQESVSLTELMDIGKIDKISAFLAILFLTAQGQVDMHQDEFYSELYVTPETGVGLTLDEDGKALEEKPVDIAS